MILLRYLKGVGGKKPFPCYICLCKVFFHPFFMMHSKQSFSFDACLLACYILKCIPLIFVLFINILTYFFTHTGVTNGKIYLMWLAPETLVSAYPQPKFLVQVFDIIDFGFILTNSSCAHRIHYTRIVCLNFVR